VLAYQGIGTRLYIHQVFCPVIGTGPKGGALYRNRGIRKQVALAVIHHTQYFLR